MILLSYNSEGITAPTCEFISPQLAKQMWQRVPCVIDDQLLLNVLISLLFPSGAPQEINCQAAMAQQVSDLRLVVHGNHVPTMFSQI